MIKKTKTSVPARRTRIADLSEHGLRLTEAQLASVAGGVTHPASIHNPGEHDTVTDPSQY